MNEINTFKNVLNYSTCNEDSLTEIKALHINATDNILCITGSGGRVLNLLTQNPKKIVAIDFNPIQNWLLELKIAAIKNLDYDEYTKFLGLNECSERTKNFNRLKHDLSKDSYEYWKRNIRLISRGIIYQGQFERKCKYIANMVKETLGEKVNKIFDFDNLEKQRKFYKKEWDNSEWKDNVDFEINRDIDPAFYLYVNDDYNIRNYISNMLDKGFNTSLIRDNHILCLLIDGNYKRLSKLPPCLQKENFGTLKNNLHKIEIITENVITFLEKHEENFFNKFSMSDVTGYLSEENSNKLYKYIVNSAVDNSKICSRSLLADREIPIEFTNIINRDIELEKKLENEDLALAYKILAATIKF